METEELVKKPREITKIELSQHDSSESCWLAINNKVYDVTKFLEKHPGGEDVLLEEAGCYATKSFRDVRHSQYAQNLLKRYQIGVMVKGDREKLGPQTGDEHASSGCVDLCCQGCVVL